MNINNILDLTSGLSLTFISLSGLKCINKSQDQKQDQKQEDQDGSKSSSETKTKLEPSTRCSKWNLNFGLSALCITGGLLVFKSVNKFR
jgi:hypothetical protein